jgi:hypothetical protein
MGRDIESRQGICWVLAFLKEEKKVLRRSSYMAYNLLLGNCNAMQCTKETGVMGRDIESRQGICWVLAFLKEEKKVLGLPSSC